MAAMAYLIVVTQRSIPKIWNPYDILGISDVGGTTSGMEARANLSYSPSTRSRSSHTTDDYRSNSIQIKRDLTPRRTRLLSQSTIITSS